MQVKLDDREEIAIPEERSERVRGGWRERGRERERGGGGGEVEKWVNCY